MAIYHYEETPVKRSKGQSAVNSAAYVLKENMRDNNISKDFSYERQNKEVEYSKTLLPEGSNFKSAEEMWNDVEKNEKSEKAVVGQRVHIAIPKELSLEAAKQLVDEYALARAKEGRGVSIAFHNEPGNPHIDAILTPRPWQPGKGWGAKSQSVIMTDKDGNPILNPNRGKAGQPIHKRKNVNIDDKTNLTRRRKEWEELANAKLAQEGFSERIDCRTLKAQRQEAEQEYLAGRGSYEKVIELSRTPTIHEYRIKERKELNEKIKAGNAELKKSLTDEWNLEKQICKASLKINRTKWRKNENERRKGKTTEYLINDRSAGLVFSASLNEQQNDNINRTIAQSNGVSELSKRGVDGTQKKHISANVLLPRIESDDMGNERNRKRLEGRRTYRNLSTSHTQYNRRRYNRGHRAGAVTICSWAHLTRNEKNAVADEFQLRTLHKDDLADFCNKSVFVRDKESGIRLLGLNKKTALSVGLWGKQTPQNLNKSLQKLSKTKLDKNLFKYTKSTCISARRDSGRALSKLKSIGGGMKQTASAASMAGSRSAFKGALDSNKTGVDHIKDGLKNVKNVCKTPFNVAKDVLSNPFTAIFKFPARVAEAFDNAVSAAINFAVAPAKGTGNDKKSGGGFSADPVRVRTRGEDEDKNNGLDSWKYMSEARKAEKEIKNYMKEVHI